MDLPFFSRSAAVSLWTEKCPHRDHQTRLPRARYGVDGPGEIGGDCFFCMPCAVFAGSRRDLSTALLRDPSSALGFVEGQALLLGPPPPCAQGPQTGRIQGVLRLRPSLGAGKWQRSGTREQGCQKHHDKAFLLVVDGRATSPRMGAGRKAGATAGPWRGCSPGERIHQKSRPSCEGAHLPYVELRARPKSVAALSP